MYYFRILVALFYIVVGFLTLLEVITPYQKFPTVEEIAFIPSYVMVQPTSEKPNSLIATVNGIDYVICEKMWVPLDDINESLKPDKNKKGSIGIESEHFSSIEDNNLCLKIYSLSIEGEAVFSYEDAQKVRNYIKIFFNIISVIFLIYGVYLLFRIRRVLDKS